MKKQPKKKNPFKVDHVRSIKLKAKAKQYTGHLKQIKNVVSDKVKSTNEQLSAIEGLVRQAPKADSLSKNTNEATKDVKMVEAERKQVVENYQALEKDQTEALDKMSSWKC